MNTRFVGFCVLIAVLLITTTSCNIFTKPDKNRVAKPAFSPEGGAYDYGQAISIFSSTPGASIFYSMDGSSPTIPYVEPIILRNGNHTLKAVATRLEWQDSRVATAEYHIQLLSPQVFVQGGTFNNGTSDVTLSSFSIDKYEVTQAAYQAVMGTNPSLFSGNPNSPVEQVSWFNAIEYCNRRSMQEGLTPCYSYGSNGTNPATWPAGWNTSDENHTNISCNWTANGYRLPTEMEWMFAARGGNLTHNYSYSGSNTIDDVAWHDLNSGGTTHDVGTKAANELGIFDMTGNVWEWCWDIYSTYPSSAQTNPHGVSSGSHRVIRGGGWGDSAGSCTVSRRVGIYATYSDFNVGFRCVRVSP